MSYLVSCGETITSYSKTHAVCSCENIFPDTTKALRTEPDLVSCLQIPHLHSDGAPGHPGHHQRARPPQVPQVVQVHHRLPEERAVEDNSRGPEDAGGNEAGVHSEQHKKYSFFILALMNVKTRKMQKESIELFRKIKREF